MEIVLLELGYYLLLTMAVVDNSALVLLTP